MEELLEELVAECRGFTENGQVANYIPELSKVDPHQLGIYVINSDGRNFCAGDWDKKFTIQSIIKPILLLQALMDNGIEKVRSQIGVEATGKPFDAINYSDQALLSEHLNPMVNMGAIKMCTMISGESPQRRLERVLELTRCLAGNPMIQIDENIYHSEKQSGNKNRALAYLLKSQGMIQDDVEELLDCYFQACSIQVDCKDLAHIGYVFSNRGKTLNENAPLFDSHYAKYVNAILVTCGMYDGSGDFAIKVGVPAKSGVGGGIMAAVPTRMGIGIYSPSLDHKGNSIAGVELLHKLSARLYLSIF